MTVGRSTIFWKHLGIETTKRAKTIKNYRVSTDYNALKKKGVLQADIDTVYRKSIKFKDELFFNKYSRFFRKDVDTITLWVKAADSSKAFVKLYNKIHAKGLVKALPEMEELDIIFKFYDKGIGRIYEGVFVKSRPLSKFNPVDVIRRLNRFDNAKYSFFKFANLGNDKIIAIKKKAGPKITYKFIKLSVVGDKIIATLSMDSNREYNFAKIGLEKSLNTILDTPQSKRPFNKLRAFLKSGDSEKFMLAGCTYFENEFKLTIAPAFAQLINIASSQALQDRLEATQKKEELISQLRIYYKDKRLIRPINLSFLTNRNAGIIGAIMISPNDRKLTTKQRNDLYADFLLETEIPLNEFVDYEDLAEKEIYRYFLETNTKKDKQIEVRSSTAMRVYKNLLSDKLIDESEITKDQAKFCVNSECSNKFKTAWNEDSCRKCGEILIGGKKIVTKTINEERIIDFLKLRLSPGSVVKLSNQLLSRKLFVGKITYNNKTAEVIPITKSLNEHQLEILKFRYPHAILITSKDDISEMNLKGCTAVSLFDLIYSIKNDSGKVLTDLISSINVQYTESIRTLFTSAITRITDDTFYKSKNKVTKNLGAELFEADASVIMDFVFGNCLWLGAKYRGKKVPDGFTAFPLLSSGKGCFIWDGKFSEGRKPVMGNYSKNLVYIEAAKKNPTLKANGGLSGFVFIANKSFPNSFEKKYDKLAGRRKIKITFLTADQLQKIGIHFRENERLIQNNLQAKEQFITSLATIFFDYINTKKVAIVDTKKIDDLLTSNESFYRSLNAGKLLKV